MGLTSAILTGFTGITSNQFAVETIGNNVANVNTTAYKNSRALFETLMFQTTSDGTRPSAETGGTNPIQFGYGSTLATTQRNFNQGGTERTGVTSDLAVDGRGFFVLQNPDGTTVYTRDGAFSLNSDQTLVTSNGALVQGYSAGEDGTIDTGALGNIVLPIGELTSAGATTNAALTGNLNATSELAVAGSVSTSAPLTTTGGAAATAATALTAITDGNGVARFNAGDVLFIGGRPDDESRAGGIQKGAGDVPPRQFIVGTDGSTYGDLAAFVQTTLGIGVSETEIGTPGVTIGDGTSAPAGAMVIRSNVGEVNAIDIDGASIRNETTGTQPFSFTTTPAIGDGVTTSFLVFDTLGTPVEVRLRMALESRSDAGNTWRFRAESVTTDGTATFLDGGTLAFDTNGRLVTATGTQLSVPGADSGAAAPVTFEVDFSAMTGLTAVDGVSTVALADQDGFPQGTLTGYAIDLQGIISGTFSNAETRVFGQVPLATFVNEQGLVASSENIYTIGPNSGPATVNVPRTGSAGAILSGELELSNVDLSRELIGLITASTGFSAASRTVRTADDMLQELMLLIQ
ncbi:MAG: flagellar hook-basal body complex protein [Phycisphaerales bacterium]|nr:flagellar hook-basal body complex protein [Phycisphaerales bacterium]